MSFILDALKKSDQKQRRRPLPDLLTVQDLPPVTVEQPRRPLWPWLLAAGLLLNSAVLLWWLKPWRPSPDGGGQEPAATSGQPSRPQAAAESAGPPPLPTTPEASSRASGAEKLRWPPRSSAESARGRAGAVAPPQEDGGESPLSAGAVLPAGEHLVEDIPLGEEPWPAEEALGWESEPEDAPSAEQTEYDRLAAMAVEDTFPQETQLPAGTVDLTGRTSSGEPNIPTLAELPQAVRTTLPALTISFHSFSHQPSSRLASINGRVYRQGQLFDGDLIVEEITADGVVFRRGDLVFRLPVFR